MRLALAAYIFLLSAGQILSSHFRGGTISWKHLGSNGNVHEIRFSYRFGYRRDYFSSQCDDALISSRIPGYGEGSWNLNGASVAQSLPTTDIICTTYDSTENWMYGYNSFDANITTLNGPISFWFTGNAWISTSFLSGGGWSLVASDISLGIRSDTGLVNNPPTTFSLPVVRLKEGCPSTIDIKSTDGDNDRVTCRYASGTDECASVCFQYQHFYLDEDACTIFYDGAGGNYLIPIALMLEDHPRQGITLDGTQFIWENDTLSQIPLQFLVDIQAATACNVEPTYPSFSIAENVTITVSSSGSLNETLFAYPSAGSLTIIQFIILGPLGVQSSGIYTIAGGIYATDISWAPDSSQSGTHIICYNAVDSGGNIGQQLCFTVEVAAITSPCDKNNGGCSDLCVPQGFNSYCTCSHSCWNLIYDGKTCAPSMEITCTGDHVDINVQGCASNRTIVAGTNYDYFTSETCQSVLQNSSHRLSFGSDECGVTYQVNPVEIQYAIYLWVWEEEYTGSNVITRGEWRNIPITCSLPSIANVAASFVPIQPLGDEFFPEDIFYPEIGTVTLYFEFYRNDTFTTVYGPTDYPLQVTVNDFLHFAVGAVARPGLVFFAESCVATATNSATGGLLSYTMIDNGCLAEGMVVHSTPNLMENRFSIRAFEFSQNLASDRQSADISIECEVILCDAANSTTRCFQGCLSSSRRRRSVEAGYLNAESRSRRNTEEDIDELPSLLVSETSSQNLRTRFILIGDEDDSLEIEKSNFDYTNWILIGIGGLILVIAVIVAYKAIKRRQSKAATNLSYKSNPSEG